MKLTQLFHFIYFTIKTLVLAAFLFTTTVYGQVTITTNDMPSPGDTIRKSQAITTAGVDYTLSGPNYDWDFSGLNLLLQNVDEYKSVSEVPFLYQLVFIPGFVANLAQEYPGLDTLGLPLTDPYRFFKNSSSSFTDVGFALTVSDIPLPLKFDNADVMYKFPMNYGNADSSISGLDFGIPDLGFISVDRKRVNEVDGWGSLTTSYGTFDVLRLKSMVWETDSIYIDSIGFGTALERNYTEYKWLGNGFAAPLLQVTEEGVLLTVSWIDSIFDPSVDIAEEQLAKSGFQIAPNPLISEGMVSVNMSASGAAEIAVYNVSGAHVGILFSGTLQKGTNHIPVSAAALNLESGFYISRLTTAAAVQSQKMIVR
jgi:hypothetical protein